jgi:hypothetical protein
MDRLCGLMVRDSGCRPIGPAFDSRRDQVSCVAFALERGPFTIVRINEELLEGGVAAPV